MMLLGQDGRRHEDGDLLTPVDRLERRADRHLGFAIADVATDQAIHRPVLRHVFLDRIDRRKLVGRFLVGEALPRIRPSSGCRRLERQSQAGSPAAAWMSISSAARSTTASATRFFRFSQADEPIFESGGVALLFHRHSSGPGRSSRSARTFSCLRRTRAAGFLRCVRSCDPPSGDRDNGRSHG